MEAKKERLFSLDLLRGVDMILLTLVVPLIRAAHQAWKLPDSIMSLCIHTWGDFTFYDVIMPCFIFMCGAAIPFALSRRLEDGKPTAEFWRHLAWRFVMLYALGSVCQCNLLSLDPMNIHVFYNTLQVIAVAYVATALTMLIPSRRIQVAIPIALAVIMGVVVHYCGHGDYSKTGNFTYVFDRMVWGWFLPAGQHSLKPNGYVTYLLPQLVCCSIAMCGYECTLILRGTQSPWNRAGRLLALAAALFLSAWLVSFKVPVIKHIFSLSFSLYATAWSVLSLALLYIVADIWKLRRGTWLITLFGRNALCAYLLAGVFHSTLFAAANHFAQGFPHWLGNGPQPFVLAVFMAIELIVCIYIWDRFKKSPKSFPVVK